MMLWQQMLVPCVLMDKRSVPDELGGFHYEWQDGAGFSAAIEEKTSAEAMIAEKLGVTELYTVTFEPGIKLSYHDVFRRISDGAVFRVTENDADSQPPKMAGFNFSQVRAERWEIPS